MNLLEKIKEFYQKRKIVILLGISIVLIIFFALTTNRQDTSLPVPSPSPSPISNIEIDDFTETVPTTGNELETYLSNQVVSNVAPVTGYSWNGNKLFYSNPNGVYEAGTNKVLLQKDISKILWADNAVALINSSGVWSVFDGKDLTNKQININLTSPKINNDGNLVVDYSTDSVSLYDATTNKATDFDIKQTVQDVLFSDNNKVVVVANQNTKTYIYLIEDNKLSDKTQTIDGIYTLSSISTNGERFALTSGNELLLGDFQGNIQTDLFLTGSNLFSSFYSDDNLLVVEKYRDNLGRTLDNIYYKNVSGTRYKLSDSKPLVNRINPNIALKFNSDKTIASFAENEGKIWILSLKPNLLPTYSTQGDLVLTVFTSKTHPDAQL